MFQLSNQDFNQLGGFIQEGYGIKMPMAKKTMLQARLQKRLRVLGLDSFKDYIDYVFDSGKGDEELVHMIDAVTTNKTDFFREPNHFKYLVETVLPGLTHSLHHGSRKLVGWSAGCSTGEEPYTIAMVLEDYFAKNGKNPYSIVATDISSQVLDIARLAIYDLDKVVTVPYQMKKEYLLQSKDKSQKKVRIVPELRRKIIFRTLNFMDNKYSNIVEKMDFIFCRNVIIYFERAIQAEIIGKLVKHLRPNGFLFLGHSETIFGLDLPLKQVASTVYQKVAEK